MFLEYSIISIDFIFLENISYLATIGVGSLVSLIYMIQRIIVLFVQSLVDNSLYKYTQINNNYKYSLLFGFVFSIVLSIIISLIFFSSKEFILSFFKINPNAKFYALQYIDYMILFLIIFSIQQYFHYILYSLKLAKLNLIIMIYMVILNFIFNYVSFYILKLGVIGIAIASNLALLFTLPIYIYIIVKKKMWFFKISALSYKYFNNSIVGIKNIGFASIIEPILVQGVDVVIKILIVSFVAQEALSARVHSSNYFTLALSFSVALGICLQMLFSKLLGKHNIKIVDKIYKKSLIFGLMFVIILSVIVYVLVYINSNIITKNIQVKDYILFLCAFAVILEPIRMLSIASKSYLKGMQKGNIVVIITFAIKLCVVYPLIYIFLTKFSMGLYAIVLAELINYMLNFICYSASVMFYKKRFLTYKY